jgi:GNAT superfamily N-acetyltransferase
MACLFVVEDHQGKVQGFVAGTTNTSLMYRHIVARNWLRFPMLLLPAVLNLANLRRIVETLLYGFTHKSGKTDGRSTVNNTGAIGRDEDVSGELLSIAVDAGARKSGVGKKLVARLDEWFTSRRIYSYKTVTSAMDQGSNSFYVRTGFRLAGQFSHHGNRLNRYVRTLQQDVAGVATETQRHREEK